VALVVAPVALVGVVALTALVGDVGKPQGEQFSWELRANRYELERPRGLP